MRKCFGKKETNKNPTAIAKIKPEGVTNPRNIQESI